MLTWERYRAYIKVMARTLVDIPRDMLDALDTERALLTVQTAEKVSRSALIRRALREWLEARRVHVLDPAE